MKTLIIFSSSHGTTEKASHLLQEQLQGTVDIINLKKISNPNLTHYDSIIIGCSIHVGTAKSKVKQYIKENQTSLLDKRLGLFLCCMFEGEKAIQQFETTYPKELREHSSSNGLFGGEFLVSKMNFLERQIVKKVAGVTSDESKINLDEIKTFAEKFHKQ